MEREANIWSVNETSTHCDNAIEARRPDIVAVDQKRKNCLIEDIGIPADVTLGEKEKEKIGKYQDLKEENWKNMEFDRCKGITRCI